ncbi:MAG TPA: hypothetical protein VNZ06_10445 [Steroidobacteraceae bacterium]|nr:hypothetical protein [Steroidobacteraceae bacterium]
MTLVALWLPILLSAVIAFMAGWLMHMFVRHHRNDFKAVPNEPSACQSLGSLGLTPGDYFIPHASQSQRSSAPVTVIMTVMRPGGVQLGSALVQWFLYQLAISFLCAYVASRTLAFAAPYLNVFRVVGTVGFMAYSVAYAHESIWWQRGWGITVRYMFDGLVYSLLTAGVFGWLWPR